MSETSKLDKPRQVYIIARYGKGRTHTAEFSELKKKLTGFGFNVTNVHTSTHKFITDTVEAILASDIVVVAGEIGDYQKCVKASTEVGIAKWGGVKMIFMSAVVKDKDPDQYLFKHVTGIA